MALLICLLDLDRITDEQESLEDILDLTKLETDKYGPGNTWLSIATRSVCRNVCDLVRRKLELNSERVLVSRRTTGLDSGAILLAGVLSHLKGDVDVTAYGCNDDRHVWVNQKIPEEVKKVRAMLGRVNEAHRIRHLSECYSISHEILNLAEKLDSYIGRTIAQNIRPLTRYLDAYQRMLKLRLPAELSSSFLFFEAFCDNIDLKSNVNRLETAEGGMPEPIRRTDFVQVSLRFFRSGFLVMKEISESTSEFRTSRHAVHVFLVWICGLLLSASKEEANRSNNNTSLLLCFRALELYFIAYLYDIRQAAVESDRGSIRITLQQVNGRRYRERPGFRNISDAFFDCAPPEFSELLVERIDLLIHSRNKNILSHGLDLADSNAVKHARGCFKLVAKHWDEQYVSGSGLKEGPTGRFIRGENWNGDLGNRIAESVIDKLLDLKLPK